MSQEELEELLQQLDGLAQDIASQPQNFPPEYGWGATRLAALRLNEICIRARKEKDMFQFIQAEVNKLSKWKKNMVIEVAGMFDWNLKFKRDSTAVIHHAE